jgi:hypothetical protein
MTNTSKNVPPVWNTDAATDLTYSTMTTSVSLPATPYLGKVTVTNNTNGPWTFNDSGMVGPNSAKISLKGENADIEIGDKSLMSILDAIERKLGLVKLNPELEAEFEELRRIGDEYRAVEKRMLEKRQIWETLKR